MRASVVPAAAIEVLVPHASVRRGVSLTETLFLLVLVGVAGAVVVPPAIISRTQQAAHVAEQLADDLDALRSAATEQRRVARVVFDPVGGSYDSYLAVDGDGVITYGPAEQAALAGSAVQSIDLPVRLGRGARPAVPGYPEADAVSFAGAAITFDARGLLQPLGDRGVIYLRAVESPDALAAVSISGNGTTRVWRWHDGDGWR